MTAPVDGLLHIPSASDWDLDTYVWAPRMAYAGVTSGWDWATDTSTICAERTDEPDTDPQPSVAPSVMGFLFNEPPDGAVMFKVARPHLAALGGAGFLRDWGPFDLDRVQQAAFWVLDEGAHLIAVPSYLDDKPAVRLIGPTGRVAIVVGIVQHDSRDWLPAIDIPAELVA